MIWLKTIILCIAIIIFCIVSAITTLIIWGIVELIKLIRRIIWKIKLK